MARRKRQEEHENHERWLISYADFITLLFAFFVVMYAVSSVNEGKYRVLSDSLINAFKTSARSLEPVQVGKIARSNLPDAPGILQRIDLDALPGLPPPPPPQTRKKPEQAETGPDPTDEARRALEAAMKPLIRNGLVNVRRKNNNIEVEIRSSILDPSGSAVLSEHAIPVLKHLAAVLKTLPNPVHVEGYTDNIPIRNLTYPSNWELSAARAASVVRVLAREGVDPKRMAAIGYGEFRPVASNDTPAGRRRNRRVVLVLPAIKQPREQVTPAGGGKAAS